MPAVLHSVLIHLARSWRRLPSSGFALLFARGREALLRRAEAHTELEELAVEQRRLELAKQRIDLVKKIEGIKDPQLREKAKAAILASGQFLLPQEEPAE